MDALKAYDVEEICGAGLYIVDVVAVFAQGLGGRADDGEDRCSLSFPPFASKLAVGTIGHERGA